MRLGLSSADMSGTVSIAELRVPLLAARLLS